MNKPGKQSKHMSHVLDALNHKTRPNVYDLIAVIKETPRDEIPQEVIDFLEGKPKLIGRPHQTFWDKVHKEWEAVDLIFTEYARKRDNTGEMISKTEAIKKVASKNIKGFGKSALEEILKDFNTEDFEKLYQQKLEAYPISVEFYEIINRLKQGLLSDKSLTSEERIERERKYFNIAINRFIAAMTEKEGYR